MKKNLFIFSLSMLLLFPSGFAGEECCGPKKESKEKMISEKPVSDQSLKMNKTCPVMGGQTNPELFVEYKDKKIYVCCPGCIKEVKKNPEKYADMIS